jgi:hypothetical protein
MSPALHSWSRSNGALCRRDERAAQSVGRREQRLRLTPTNHHNVSTQNPSMSVLPDAAQAIDDAYALRSQIIHSGVPADLDVDLERESREISTIIRAMYASILKRELVRGG